MPQEENTTDAFDTSEHDFNHKGVAKAGTTLNMTGRGTFENVALNMKHLVDVMLTCERALANEDQAVLPSTVNDLSVHFPDCNVAESVIWLASAMVRKDMPL